MPASIGKKPRNNSGPKPKVKPKGAPLTQKEVDGLVKKNKDFRKRMKKPLKVPNSGKQPRKRLKKGQRLA